MAPCVIFNIANRNGEWHVLRGMTGETLGRFKDKSDAIERGRDLAMAEEFACLRISKIDGSIQSESIFGHNPQEMEGAFR